MTIFSAFIGITNAEMTSSFDMETIGVEVNGIEIDSNDVVVVLDVNVIEDSGSITITFEREFFDSLYYDNDDEFVIIADGNNVHYNEINTNSESRTIQFKLNSDIEAVEIFGTQSDVERGLAMARRIRTGTVSVAGGRWFHVDTPFGGYKQSGVGRENGVQGFEEYLETKVIAIPSTKG